jgi:hypothetical protein
MVMEPALDLDDRARFGGAAHHGACPRGNSTDGQKSQANPIGSGIVRAFVRPGENGLVCGKELCIVKYASWRFG